MYRLLSFEMERLTQVRIEPCYTYSLINFNRYLFKIDYYMLRYGVIIILILFKIIFNVKQIQGIQNKYVKLFQV